ncbi:sterol desaturase family protein [soil metagenome]
MCGMSLTDILILIGSSLAFVMLERLRPRHADQRVLRPGWRTDLLHMTAGAAIIRLGMVGVGVLMSLLAVHLVPDRVASAVRAEPDWVQFVELLLLADLGVYVVHRSCHALPWLWRFHAVHHSSEHLDWAASHRVHPVEQVLFSTAAVAPAILLGISPGPLVAYVLIYNVHALLLHANVQLDFGPLKHVFGSPNFHHWHHADQREAYDRNFAAQLSLWDHLFGTFRLPDQASPDRYGVDEPVPTTFLGQLTHPVRPISRRSAVSAPGRASVTDPVS